LRYLTGRLPPQSLQPVVARSANKPARQQFGDAVDIGLAAPGT
jgi:hypothetical protein